MKILVQRHVVVFRAVSSTWVQMLTLLRNGEWTCWNLMDVIQISMIWKLVTHFIANCSFLTVPSLTWSFLLNLTSINEFNFSIMNLLLLEILAPFVMYMYLFDNWQGLRSSYIRIQNLLENQKNFLDSQGLWVHHKMLLYLQSNMFSEVCSHVMKQV